eukprot:sb/3464047/
MADLNDLIEDLDTPCDDKDIAEHETRYNEELSSKPVVSTQTQFGYAYVLVKSRYDNDIRKGIRLLEELCQSGVDQRDFVYFLAVGYYRLGDSRVAIKYCERILEMEPGNSQARQLIEVIKKKRKKDAMIGAAVLGGGAVAVTGGLLVAGAVIGAVEGTTMPGCSIVERGTPCTNTGTISVTSKRLTRATNQDEDLTFKWLPPTQQYLVCNKHKLRKRKCRKTVPIMYLIATSDEQNPSQFVFRPEVPIDLTGGYEVAVKSVSHGPSSTFNVTEGNNSFLVSNARQDYESRDYSIPPGYYRNGEQLLLAMQRAITTKEMYNSVNNGSKRWYIPDYTTDEATNICSLTYNDSYIRFAMSQNSLLRSFKNNIKVSPLQYNVPSQISAKIEDFPRHAKLGYIYSSIASSDMTRMDYRRKEKQHSGFLAMFLLEEKLGYNHYEFVNPSYFYVMSKSFSEIKVRVVFSHKTWWMNREYHQDQGKLFEFSEDDARDFPTSMLLHLRRTS